MGSICFFICRCKYGCQGKNILTDRGTFSHQSHVFTSQIQNRMCARRGEGKLIWMPRCRVAFSQKVFTFMDDTSCLHQGWALPLQPRAVLDGGNQLLVCWVAFLQSGHVPVQSPGPAVGPARGARGLAVCSSPGLGEAPPCRPAAVVRQGEGANATVQGVRGGPRTWEKKWIIEIGRASCRERV